MTKNFAASLLAAALCCAALPPSSVCAQDAPRAAQNVAVAKARDTAGREFRFLSTTKVSTFEKELNDLAAQGFRVERVAETTLNDDLAALLVRNPETPEARYEYKTIATQKAGTMEREVQELAAQGYELRGLMSLQRITATTLLFNGDETAALMERPAGQTARRFDYKMISTRREKTTQKELDETVAAGFVPIDMVRGQDNGAKSLLLGPQIVITIFLQRPAGATPAQGEREFKFLTTSKVGTMKREMNEAAREGYRFYMSSPSLLMMMSRQRGEKTPAPVEYELLATNKTGTMQKELATSGEAGYRYLATSSGLGGLTTVLERDTAPADRARREYKLLATAREATTQREIAETLAAGYELRDLTTIGEFIIVLDRRIDGAVRATN